MALIEQERGQREERRGSRDRSVSAGLGLMWQKSISEPRLQTQLLA